MQSHVADNVRAEAARRGKNQGDLAQLLGISRQGVSQRLLGRIEFRVGELQAIAAFLNVPIATLVPDQAVPSKAVAS
ncbi:helix-turn-helix transcriptional regulator [Mycobacteroides abscessus]|uniref:helix-turn-helix transcriptional regulator n=1 Tax=Mycobacteroides abscessus TaxID=36809 RepID=UPI0013F5E00E|nr:helix-turn-helix transcriptional regulator [Mycobacteroides abscessus]